MDLDKPLTSLTAAERHKAAENLAAAKRYGKPRRVWVEDGHVFVEGYDEVTISMTPEVAIEMGRLLTEAGSDSLINRVMDEASKPSYGSPQL